MVNTTSEIYKKDKKVLRVSTRSWQKNVQNLYFVNENKIENKDLNQKNFNEKNLFPDFFGSKNEIEKNIFEILILFDSEYSCTLANEHINSRRYVQFQFFLLHFSFYIF